MCQVRFLHPFLCRWRVPACCLPMCLEAPNARGLNEHTSAFNEKVPVEIGFKSFMMFCKRQVQKLCKKKKLLSQIFSMVIFYFKSKKQSIFFMLLLAASPSSAPSSNLSHSSWWPRVWHKIMLDCDTVSVAILKIEADQHIETVVSFPFHTGIVLLPPSLLPTLSPSLLPSLAPLPFLLLLSFFTDSDK